MAPMAPDAWVGPLRSGLPSPSSADYTDQDEGEQVLCPAALRPCTNAIPSTIHYFLLPATSVTALALLPCDSGPGPYTPGHPLGSALKPRGGESAEQHSPHPLPLYPPPTVCPPRLPQPKPRTVCKRTPDLPQPP